MSGGSVSANTSSWEVGLLLFPCLCGFLETSHWHYVKQDDGQIAFDLLKQGSSYVPMLQQNFHMRGTASEFPQCFAVYPGGFLRSVELRMVLTRAYGKGRIIWESGLVWFQFRYITSPRG